VNKIDEDKQDSNEFMIIRIPKKRLERLNELEEEHLKKTLNSEASKEKN
jgi:hypothetical protein